MERAIRVATDGSVRLPSALRSEVGLKPGQRVQAVPKGKCILQVPDVDIRTLRGTAQGANLERIGDE